MLSEHQAVGTGNLDTLVLQCADDRLEQRPALAHENEHIAITRGAPLDTDPRAAFAQAAHRTSDALRELHAWRGLIHRIERRVPALDLLAFVGFFRLPDFDHARRR